MSIVRKIGGMLSQLSLWELVANFLISHTVAYQQKLLIIGIMVGSLGPSMSSQDPQSMGVAHKGHPQKMTPFHIVLYSSIYIAPLSSHRQTEALLVRLAPRKETSFKK